MVILNTDIRSPRRLEEFRVGLDRLSMCLLRTDMGFNQFDRLVGCRVQNVYVCVL